jgi:hypothetical protein
MCGGIAGALAIPRPRRPTPAGERGGRPLVGAWRSQRPTTSRAWPATRWRAHIVGLLGPDAAARRRRRAAVGGAARAGGARDGWPRGRLLFGWRLLDPLEAAGAGLWRRVVPANGRIAAGASRGGLGGAIVLGLAWGWLPCGLTYSMLLLAATTASAADGCAGHGGVRGVGTLPAMVSATVAFERAARLLAARATLRTVAGHCCWRSASWTAGNAAWHALAHGARPRS